MSIDISSSHTVLASSLLNGPRLWGSSITPPGSYLIFFNAKRLQKSRNSPAVVSALQQTFMPSGPITDGNHQKRVPQSARIRTRHFQRARKTAKAYKAERSHKRKSRTTFATLMFLVLLLTLRSRSVTRFPHPEVIKCIFPSFRSGVCFFLP